MKPKDYDTTIARIAGNIVGHLIDPTFDAPGDTRVAVIRAVAIAQMIVNEVRARAVQDGDV